MKLTIILLILITGTICTSVGANNLNPGKLLLTYVKYDSSGAKTEVNTIIIQPFSGSISYLSKDKEGESRPFINGELDKIKSAIKSQLSYSRLRVKHNHIQRGTAFERFKFEYDDGGFNIAYHIKKH